MSPARRPGDRRPSYESYKDSGVQWLGSIPTHWTTSRLRATDRATPGQACRLITRAVTGGLDPTVPMKAIGT
jgi:hypothetical protein